jgi:succinate dehydrogenase / fumarate reductase cytochrome b subunit
MQRTSNTPLVGSMKYRSLGLLIFMLHRIAGLATLVFLTLHIATTATVFFAPQWYDILIQMFRNPIIMIIEIILAFFIIFHGVNGLRIAYIDLFRPDLWKRQITRKYIYITGVITTILWLPALGILGYDLLKYGFGLFGGG